MFLLMEIVMECKLICNEINIIDWYDGIALAVVAESSTRVVLLVLLAYSLALDRRCYAVLPMNDNMENIRNVIFSEHIYTDLLGMISALTRNTIDLITFDYPEDGKVLLLQENKTEFGKIYLLIEEDFVEIAIERAESIKWPD